MNTGTAHSRRALKIAHVFAVHSPDGIYGGPARVAVEQARSLHDMGHSVTIFAGWKGTGPPPSQIDGVDAVLKPVLQLSRKLGFAGILAPGLLIAFHKLIRNFDIVHVHLARDLITLPMAAFALMSGRSVVLQTHGMIDQSTNSLAVPLDALLTRRVLARSPAVLALSNAEGTSLLSVGAHEASISVVGNGIRPAKSKEPNFSTRLEVLFLARLQERKRPSTFVKAAIQLAAQWPDVKFTLVGPDEGEGPAVSAMIRESGLEDQLKWTGAISPSAVGDRMRDCDLYVLPAMDEPFGLTLIEAMAVGVPVIVGEGSVLAGPIRDSGAGRTYTGTVESLSREISGFLDDPVAMRAAGKRGADYVCANWSLETITARVETIYLGVIANRATQQPPDPEEVGTE